MNKETLKFVFETINEKEKNNNSKFISVYDKLYDALEQIKDTCFGDLNSGNLIVMPYGDFIAGTHYDASLVEFLIIYQTSKENVDFSVVAQKVTKKGKVKVSTYQQIMGGATNKGIIQAEQVAERFAYYLKNQVASIEKIYFKRNEIMLRFSNEVLAKITICYNFDQLNNDLVCRRVNTWYTFNAINYLDKIQEKNKATKNNFLRIVKLFKALELELLIAQESQLYIGKNQFVENFVYNVPNQIFMEANDEILVQNVITYLLNKKHKNFMLVDGSDKMFNEKSLYSLNEAKQFANKIKYAYDNFEEIVANNADATDSKRN